MLAHWYFCIGFSESCIFKSSAKPLWFGGVLEITKSGSGFCTPVNWSNSSNRQTHTLRILHRISTVWMKHEASFPQKSVEIVLLQIILWEEAWGVFLSFFFKPYIYSLPLNPSPHITKCVYIFSHVVPILWWSHYISLYIRYYIYIIYISKISRFFSFNYPFKAKDYASNLGVSSYFIQITWNL